MMRRLDDILEALKSYHSEPKIAWVQKAYMYSAKVHAGQLRKSGEPYLVHPLEVAYLLTQLRLDEASVVCGLLHDTLEDTLATYSELEENFGSEVVHLVDGVTKLSQIHFDTDEHKQAENFRKMLLAMAKDIRVILIKLCDRLHNMRTLEYLAVHKQRRIAQETMEIYAPLANRLGLGWVKSELEDLAFCYLQPFEYNDLRQRVLTLTGERQIYVQEVIKHLHQTLADVGIVCLVEGRPKHLYSIYKKLHARNIELDQLYDVIAFRVRVDNTGLCYEVLGHVHSLWHPIPGRFKDYIAMPKANQYQSLHTAVVGPKGERIEFQIRTHKMHQVAEEGIAAHWEYKEPHHTDKKSKEQFAWLRQLLEWQHDLKDPNEFLDTVKYDLFVDEVFVFTPRGEVISLKRGATPVDFAFAIHSAIGMHCAGAKINGRMVPLRHELKNGDMVEILTHQNQRPSKDWLNFVRTGKARTKIRTIVRAEERSRSREIGQQLLDRELKRHNVSLTKFLKDGTLKNFIETSKYQTLDSLFIAIGYGRTTVNAVIEQLLPDKRPHQPANILQKLFVQAPRRSTSGVMVQGLDDVLVRFGRCCNPLPGDVIVGFITRGRGVTVHSRQCRRPLDVDPEREVEVSWDPDSNFARPIMLRASTSDRPGMLATISQVFTNHAVNILQANCKVIGQNRAVNTFEVMIKDAEQLRRVSYEIEAVSGVWDVQRL